eukprot:707985-Lingulodinium_polyedra.AAC.1
MALEKEVPMRRQGSAEFGREELEALRENIASGAITHAEARAFLEKSAVETQLWGRQENVE